MAGATNLLDEIQVARFIIIFFAWEKKSTCNCNTHMEGEIYDLAAVRGQQEDVKRCWSTITYASR
jgi:hypothetical protein